MNLFSWSVSWSWDVGIIASVIILTAYSLLIRKHKSLATLMCVYIGYLLTATWGDKAVHLLSGDSSVITLDWFRGYATPFAVQFAFSAASFIR